MARRIAKLLVGKREKGEVGYYRKLRYVEEKLREIFIGVLMALVVTIIFALVILDSTGTPDGKYVPDGYDINGNLIDTDGDGDYHHWVSE